MANITHLCGKNRLGGSVMLLDPWMSPLKIIDDLSVWDHLRPDNACNGEYG